MFPYVTHTYVSGTTCSASMINDNYTDLVNATSDGTLIIYVNEITASALTGIGGLTVNGNWDVPVNLAASALIQGDRIVTVWYGSAYGNYGGGFTGGVYVNGTELVSIPNATISYSRGSYPVSAGDVIDVRGNYAGSNVMFAPTVASEYYTGEAHGIVMTRSGSVVGTTVSAAARSTSIIDVKGRATVYVVLDK